MAESSSDVPEKIPPVEIDCSSGEKELDGDSSSREETVEPDQIE